MQSSRLVVFAAVVLVARLRGTNAAAGRDCSTGRLPPPQRRPRHPPRQPATQPVRSATTGGIPSGADSAPLWSWNNVLWPLVVMLDPDKKVAQVAIAAAFTEAGSNRPLWGEAVASSAAATVPLLIIFFILQRYCVRGVVMSGMQG